MSARALSQFCEAGAVRYSGSSKRGSGEVGRGDKGLSLGRASRPKRSADPLGPSGSVDRTRTGRGSVPSKRRAGASNRSSQPDHHPERLVHGLGVAKDTGYIGIQRDAAARTGLAGGRQRRHREAAGPWGTLGALVRIGPEVAPVAARSPN